MTDVRCRCSHEWGVGGDGRGAFGLGVTHQRTDRCSGRAGVERQEFGDAADVDNVVGAPQPKGHHRQEALTTGKDLGVVTELGQEREGLGERLRAVVDEWGILHTISEPGRIEPSADTT
jgi:hypothetical protein